MQNLFIVWNDDLNSGIPIIDEQHRGIVATINTLFYFIQEGDGIEALKPSLLALEYYIETHFRTEKKILEKTDFAELESHLQLHEDMKKEKERIEREAMSNKDPMVLLSFLKEWLPNHLINEDAKYIPYLKKLIDSNE
jgi:hemerythrin